MIWINVIESEYSYQIAMREVVVSELGKRPANNTNISKAQYSRLVKQNKHHIVQLYLVALVTNLRDVWFGKTFFFVEI